MSKKHWTNKNDSSTVFEDQTVANVESNNNNKQNEHDARRLYTINMIRINSKI